MVAKPESLYYDDTEPEVPYIEPHFCDIEQLNFAGRGNDLKEIVHAVMIVLVIINTIFLCLLIYYIVRKYCRIEKVSFVTRM